jgi:hypothetical protein
MTPPRGTCGWCDVTHMYKCTLAEQMYDSHLRLLVPVLEERRAVPITAIAVVVAVGQCSEPPIPSCSCYVSAILDARAGWLSSLTGRRCLSSVPTVSRSGAKI